MIDQIFNSDYKHLKPAKEELFSDSEEAGEGRYAEQDDEEDSDSEDDNEGEGDEEDDSPWGKGREDAGRVRKVSGLRGGKEGADAASRRRTMRMREKRETPSGSRWKVESTRMGMHTRVLFREDGVRRGRCKSSALFRCWGPELRRTP